MNKFVADWIKKYTIQDPSNKTVMICVMDKPIPENWKKTDILNADVKPERANNRIVLDRVRNILIYYSNEKYLYSLTEIGDNLPRLFLNLRQIFQEEAVKYFFPTVWEAYKAVADRKAATTKEQEANRLRNQMRRDAVEDRRDVKDYTSNMSLREAGEHTRLG